ncbi:hypothetical protein ACJIZ3_011218 [Penstemon smallii]|uniref:F-box domain-containing protein n=1 Tax=Penstemon smallii TaxID=265156 RepID=A0ABD3UIH5_9LAMI
MSSQNHLISLCNLIIPFLSFITKLFTRSSPNDYEHQECQNSDSSGVSELPSSVIFEILIKLPIQSIIRYKCVCKTWNNLILDSHFANIYLENPPFTVVYGFGFSTKSEHYKVLRFVSRYIFEVGGSGHEYGIHGEIFTIGVDHKWRSFQDSSIPFYLFPCGITINGVLHLVGDDRRSGFIFAFDLEEEKGHRIPLPPRLGDEPGNVVLAIRNGNICLCDNSNEHQVDIWTMKEYGVAESWSREIILKRRIPADLRPYPLIPITTLRNGDLLLSRQLEGDLSELRSNNLLSFDPKTKRCRKLEVPDSEGTVSFLFGYVPSFFPLNISL